MNVFALCYRLSFWVNTYVYKYQNFDYLWLGVFEKTNDSNFLIIQYIIFQGHSVKNCHFTKMFERIRIAIQILSEWCEPDIDQS